MKRLFCFALGLLLGVTPKLLSEEGDFVPFDFPGSTVTTARDINPDGQIVGRYVTAGKQHGYLRSPTGEFTSIDYPGANLTAALGINPQGDVVGAVRFPGEPNSKRHAFLLRDGAFSTFDFPGAVTTSAMGINARGDIVGVYALADNISHGFLLTEDGYTAIDFSGAAETHAWKITSRRRIVGGYKGADSTNHVFVWSDGEYSTVDLPEAPFPTLETGGINNRNEIAGWYSDTPCATPACGGHADLHGFLLRDDEFTVIEVPGVFCVTPLAINSHGDLVGAYNTNASCNDGPHGFLLSRKEMRADSGATKEKFGNTTLLLSTSPKVH